MFHGPWEKRNFNLGFAKLFHRLRNYSRFSVGTSGGLWSGRKDQPIRGRPSLTKTEIRLQSV